MNPDWPEKGTSFLGELRPGELGSPGVGAHLHGSPLVASAKLSGVKVWILLCGSEQHMAYSILLSITKCLFACHQGACTSQQA